MKSPKLFEKFLEGTGYKIFLVGFGILFFLPLFNPARTVKGPLGWKWLGYWTVAYVVLHIFARYRVKQNKPIDDIEFWRTHPRGSVSPLRDTVSGAIVGELPNELIKFLSDKFQEVGMDDNDFYFLPETLDMFIQAEKPPAELETFLRNAMQGKETMELHWD